MLHPQAQALLDFIEERKIPPTHTLSLQEARLLYRERRSFAQPAAPAVVEVRDLQAESMHGEVPVRLFRPILNKQQESDAPTGLPVLVYFHGGGWLMGDLDTHDTNRIV